MATPVRASPTGVPVRVASLTAAASSRAARSYWRAGRLTDSSPSARRYSFAGRPAPGPLTAGEPAELGGQQPVGDEPVEVERGNRPGDTHRRGGLVLADGVAPVDDEPVQGPSLRLGQRRHAGDAFLEVVVHSFLPVGADDGVAATSSARRARAPSPREMYPSGSTSVGVIGWAPRLELLLPPASDDVVAASGAKAVEVGRVAEVTALGPHGGEEPRAQPIGVVACGGQRRASGRGVGAHGRDHEVEAYVVGTQVGDRGDLVRQPGGDVALDGLTGDRDRRVVLHRPPIDLVGVGGEEHVGPDAGQRRERAVEIAVDRQAGHEHLSK